MEDEIVYTWSVDKEKGESPIFYSVEACIKNAKGIGFTGWIYIHKLELIKPTIDAMALSENVAGDPCLPYVELEIKTKNIGKLEIKLDKCLQQWLKEAEQEPQFYRECETKRVYISKKGESK